jgi:hypothetical protein
LSGYKMRSCPFWPLLLIIIAITVPGVVGAQPLPIAARVEESPLIGSVLRTVAAELLTDDMVLTGLRQAARGNDAFTLDAIIQRDVAWRLQAKRGTGALLDMVMQGEMSRNLTLVRVPRQAVLADLMLTDDRGLLVAATRIPSDYDQSDEAKYIVPTTSDPGMVHVEEAAYDESADDYVVAASILLIDPVDGRTLGVLCANFTLAALARD